MEKGKGDAKNEKDKSYRFIYAGRLGLCSHVGNF